MGALMEDNIKPIKIFGAVLIVLSLLGILLQGGPFLLDPNSPIYVFGQTHQTHFLFWFWIISVSFYFLTGVGVIYLTRWGYILFKVFLYLLFLGFPIGTFISYKTLSYMKRHQIDKYFGVRYLSL